MSCWVVTALDSEGKRAVVDVYATEDLAKRAVEICNRCTQLQCWDTWSQAEYIEMQLQHDVNDIEMLMHELVEMNAGPSVSDTDLLFVGEETD